MARANELTEPSQRAEYANEFRQHLPMKQRIYEWIDGKHKVLIGVRCGCYLPEALQIMLGKLAVVSKRHNETVHC